MLAVGKGEEGSKAIPIPPVDVFFSSVVAADFAVAEAADILFDFVKVLSMSLEKMKNGAKTIQNV